MQRIGWLIIFVLSVELQLAQSDKMFQLIDAQPNDTLRLKLYHKILDRYYKLDNFEGASKILEKTKTITDELIFKNKDSSYYRNYLSTLSTFYFYKGDFQNSLKVSVSLLGYDLRTADSAKIATSLGNLGVLYRRKGNLPKAIYCLQEAIKINEKTGAKSLANNYFNLSNLYNDVGKDEKAKQYLLKALKLRLEQKNETALALIYSSIANKYQGEHQFDSAMFYYSKSIFLNNKLGVPDSKKINTYNQYTFFFIQEKSIDSAKKYLKISEAKIKSQSNPNTLAAYYENSCNLNLLLKHNSNALSDCNRAIKYSSQISDTNSLITLLTHKAHCFANLQQFDSAYFTKILLDEYKNSFVNNSNKIAFARHEMQFEFDKEQEALKTAQQKKELESKHALEQKQFIIYSASGALILLLLLVGFILKSNQRKKRDNELLQQKNEVIEDQKRDVIDSINYAKNIQQAILPALTNVKPNIADWFVYYKPKDIVAGDFYWLYRSQQSSTNSEILFVAVADCTGHGVPGALVSVVCSNALNSAVKEFGLVDPGKILDKANELVLATFANATHTIKDGMDISFCTIQKNFSSDNNAIEVKWAGANNSLWYTQNNNLLELKADKQPIGYSEKSKPFTTHTLNLLLGDLLYFSTDGFYDQFGGDHLEAFGKKFMRKRLTALFASMYSESIERQKQILDTTFNDWKGSIEQVDDVCVVGIKL